MGGQPIFWRCPCLSFYINHMTCYQSTSLNLPGGFTTTGRTSYTTEAECNEACREGACCEGTTCTVKPACQCQGTGKTFKGVGTVCASLNGACCEGTTCSIKTSCECAGTGKTFKGVGTTCEGNPCQCCNPNGTPKSGSGCGLCYCYCTANGGKIPRFVNVTLSWTWATDRNDCSEAINTSVTLSRMGTSLGDGFSGGGTTQCYSWDFTGNGFYVSATSYIGPSNEALTASVIIRNTKCSRPNGDTLRWDFSLSSQKDKKTAQTGIGQGVCFDRHAGATSTQSTVVDGWPANPPNWQGLSGTVSGTITINGFQE
jgi:hypothetical protein